MLKTNIIPKILTVLIAGVGLLVNAGCATKSHVRNEMAPVVDKVNTLDDLTARNTNDIRDLDTRATQGIEQVKAQAAAVDQKALSASQRAGDAQTLASQAAKRADLLSNTVVNLDSYKPVAEAAVHFGFNQAVLSKKAQEALDDLAREIPNAKGYIIELEGATDSVGDAQYNYELSQRRAAAVVQYLAQTHNIPAHKIYMIGLGEDKAASDNRTAQGRARNRRVEVHLLSNAAVTELPASDEPTEPKQPE